MRKILFALAVLVAVAGGVAVVSSANAGPDQPPQCTSDKC